MANEFDKPIIQFTSNRKQISQGLALSLLLLIVTLSITYIPTIIEDNSDRTTENSGILLEAYPWDMSSGLTLAAGLDNLDKSILSLSLSFSVLEEQLEVTCEGDCDDISDDSAWAGSAKYYLSHNVSRVNAYLNLETDGWLLTMSYQNPFDPIYDIFPELLSSMYSALVQDVSTIEGLKQIEENEIDLPYHPDANVMRILNFYDEGSLIFLEIVDTTVLIRYERFTEYFSSFTSNYVHVDPSYPEVYFTGQITEFFPNYIEAINTMIDAVLEI